VRLEALRVAARASKPCVFEEIQEYSEWKEPTLFTCTSGVLLWGQLHSLMEGFTESKLDTELGPFATSEPGSNGGTILQNAFRYRAPARKGLWKVQAAYLGGTGPIGYVCHHVEMDGADLLRRAAIVGPSLVNNHPDREIVYVNRYDWAQWGCGTGSELLEEILKPDPKPKPPPKVAKSPQNPKIRVSTEISDEEEDDDDDDEEYDDDDEDEDEDDDDEFEKEEYEEALVMNRFMLVDVQGFPHIVAALKEGVKLNARNYAFRCRKANSDVDSSSSSVPAMMVQENECDLEEPFGVNLGVGEDDNELGWMAFQNGELVGFVYDGAYCDLYGRYLQYGDTVVC
jgi:hypothetical protein